MKLECLQLTTNAVIVSVSSEDFAFQPVYVQNIVSLEERDVNVKALVKMKNVCVLQIPLNVNLGSAMDVFLGSLKVKKIVAIMNKY